ncbi:Spc24-domain-containing protein [Rhizodiscina lignyota]|uniref:Kinetochore protein Spc24 n=1 Tax=Rhizodiscina lignyota TaxID=1504668 RepID=A0A9P4MBA9_9PEZI|nr:Spc24-domain-containing protein [Rhizodiscina lignyota]
MLLDEVPAALISQCVDHFNLGPDKSSLSRISDQLSTLSSARDLQLQTLQSNLKKLSRQLATVESQHRVTTSNHDASEHAHEILRLDTEKFRVAKQASDLEIEAQRMEEELRGLRATLGELDKQGVEGDVERNRDVGDDEVILKLKVFRSLGIDVEADASTGVYSKAVIRNTQKGDVHVVNIDPKFSRFFYADYFWRTM